MPKIKLATKSPHIDMTPMVDLFSVVLIFLMLTTSFRISEPSAVDTPFSVSEKTKADFDLMTVVIANDGNVFFNVDNGSDTLLAYRPKILTEMGNRYGIEFTDEELALFQKYPTSMGVPIENMKNFLAANDAAAKAAYQVGVPMDSANNQLGMWVLYARQVNPNVKACIKAGTQVPYPRVKEVLDLLMDYKVFNFSLVTNLEASEAISLEE